MRLEAVLAEITPLGHSVAMPNVWKNLTTQLLDFLLPPLCLICDEPVGGVATLCPLCWKQVGFIAPPLCACCGVPFDIPAGAGMLCGACIANTPHYQSARAAILYEESSRKLLLGFKHGDRTHAAQALAVWMHRAAGDLIAQADALLPVPLHRWRLFHRRYNQSALLAHKIAALADKSVLVDVLRRTRATPSQGHRNRKERQENVRGAFEISLRHNPAIKDKVLVLVDDVMTTGATVDECARILLKAGAKRVDIVVLARVKTVV